MATSKISSRQFNQDTSGAKRAATDGPVYITDRGRPAFVLLSYEDYERLVGGTSIIDLLGRTSEAADVDLVIPDRRDAGRAAELT